MWNLVDNIDDACLNLFGESATLLPLASHGGGSYPVTGIVKTPAVEEEYLSGSTQGVNTIRFFVRFADLTPQPQVGDQVNLNSILYNIFDIKVDVEGGAVLVLRRRG